MPVIVNGPELNSAIVLWQQQFTAARLTNSGVGDRINVTDPATWNSWNPNAGNPNLQYDSVGGYTLDSVGISAHTMGSSGASVVIQGSDDGVSWTNLCTPHAPTTNEDFIITFPEIRYVSWKLNFTGSGFSIGCALGTRRLTFPHAPLDDYTPLHHARSYTKLFNSSIKGQFIGNRVIASGAATTVDLGLMDRNWVEGNIRGFATHYNQGGYFFYAGCPSKYPLDMGYCRADSEDSTVNISWVEADKLASVSFGVESYVG